MRSSNQIIDRDYHGRPRTGINVSSNQEYIGVTAIGIVLLHFLIPPILAVLAFVEAAMAFIAIAPGFAVAQLTHHSQQGIAITLFVIGAIAWVYFSYRLLKWIIVGFVRHTRINFRGGYRGPLDDFIHPSRSRSRPSNN